MGIFSDLIERKEDTRKPGIFSDFVVGDSAERGIFSDLKPMTAQQGLVNANRLILSEAETPEDFRGTQEPFQMLPAHGPVTQAALSQMIQPPTREGAVHVPPPVDQGKQSVERMAVIFDEAEKERKKSDPSFVEQWLAPVSPEKGGVMGVAANVRPDKIVGQIASFFVDAGKTAFESGGVNMLMPWNVPAQIEASKKVMEFVGGLGKFGWDNAKYGAVVAGLGPDGWNPHKEIIQRKLSGKPMTLDELRQKYPTFAEAAEAVYANPAGPYMAMSMIKGAIPGPVGMPVAKTATESAAMVERGNRALPDIRAGVQEGRVQRGSEKGDIKATEFAQREEAGRRAKLGDEVAYDRALEERRLTENEIAREQAQTAYQRERESLGDEVAFDRAMSEVSQTLGEERMRPMREQYIQDRATLGHVPAAQKFFDRLASGETAEVGGRSRRLGPALPPGVREGGYTAFPSGRGRLATKPTGPLSPKPEVRLSGLIEEPGATVPRPKEPSLAETPIGVRPPVLELPKIEESVSKVPVAKPPRVSEGRIQKAVDAYEATGRIATRHPRKGTISLDGGRSRPEAEVVLEIEDFLKRKAEGEGAGVGSLPTTVSAVKAQPQKAPAPPISELPTGGATPKKQGFKSNDPFNQLLRSESGELNIDELVAAARNLSDATSKIAKAGTEEAVKAFAQPKEPGVVAGRETMLEHHKNWRDLEYQAKQMGRVFADAVPDKAARIAVRDALQNPSKIASLPPLQKAMAEWLRSEIKKAESVTDELGIERVELPPGVEYLPQIWKDPKTGKPYSSKYGKFARTTPRALRRTRTAEGELKYLTYRAGEAAGLEAAYDNPGQIVGDYLQSIYGAKQSRVMFDALKKLDAGNEVLLGKGQRPARLIEDWGTLTKNAVTDDYVRFDGFRNFRYAGETEGTVRLVDKPVGVHKDLWPYLRNYFESPKYDGAYQAMQVAKQIKLGLSFFHPIQLAINTLDMRGPKFLYDVTGGIVKGLKSLERGDETMRTLYRNGLETHRHPDVAPEGQVYGLPLTGVAKKISNWTLEAPTRFIFQVVQPGLKAHIARVLYDRQLPKYLKKGLTKDEAARAVVKMVDQLYSGEDWRMAMLESNRAMAELYYSPEARVRWQKALISPTWQKVHWGMAADVGKALKRKFSGDTSKPIDAERLRYFMGAVVTYTMANLYNYAMTQAMDDEGKFMFQNPEHKGYSVRAPWNSPDGRAVYFRPLKTIFEVPEVITDMFHGEFKKVLSKLNPLVSGGITVAQNVKEGEWKEAGKEATDIVTPISISGMTRPNQDNLSRALNLVGFPVSKGQYLDADREMLAAISQKKYEFIEGKRGKRPDFEPTPRAKDHKQLFDGLVAGNDKMIDEVIGRVDVAKFVAYVRGKRPFSGIAVDNEAEFKASLGPDADVQIRRVNSYLESIVKRYSERLKKY